MSQPNPLPRRRFLLLGGGTALTTLLGGAYRWSGCPLSASEICVGPCAAYLDLDGNGVCDRVAENDIAREGDRSANADGASGVRVGCPFGLVNDPYPGECRHYVDRNGDGICDLSEPGSGEHAAREESSPGSELHEEGEGDRKRQGRGRGGGRKHGGGEP